MFELQTGMVTGFADELKKLSDGCDSAKQYTKKNIHLDFQQGAIIYSAALVHVTNICDEISRVHSAQQTSLAQSSEELHKVAQRALDLDSQAETELDARYPDAAAGPQYLLQLESPLRRLLSAP